MKNKVKYSKLIVLLVILLNVGFACGVFLVFWHTGNEPTMLVGSWFAFTTGELWMLSGIKKKEVRKDGYNNNSRVNNIYNSNDM